MDVRLTQGERQVNGGTSRSSAYRDGCCGRRLDRSVGDGKMNTAGSRPTLLRWTSRWCREPRRGAPRRRLGGSFDASPRTSGIATPSSATRSGRLESAGAGLRRGHAGSGSDPRVDAGRRPVARRRVADGVREPGVRAPSGRSAGRAAARSIRRASARRSCGRTRPAGSRSRRSRRVRPTRWLRVTATPTGADGSVLVVIADVTEARRLDAVRRDFVANASHELKTPAASIQAAAETLLQRMA